MKILVTGAAGFIGFHLSKVLLANGHSIIGIDNLNDYYDPGLKLGRLNELGLNLSSLPNYNHSVLSTHKNLDFNFIRLNLEDRDEIPLLFQKHGFDAVCNLAAQAGVRYSLENPESYIDSNIVGFLNILEACRHNKIKHLVYASSSSVYGLNSKIPFSTEDKVDTPISLYAASKKSNELMAHTYSHLYGIRTTGLRFFTVYGPWGRPDMAMFLFTKAILENKPIKVFNEGKMARDFTYVDDIVEGIRLIIENTDSKTLDSSKLYKLYNIGNNNSVNLMDFIGAIENKLCIQALKQYMPIQPGDVEKTWANVDNLISEYGYCPNTPIEVGVSRFVDWYKDYYKVG